MNYFGNAQLLVQIPTEQFFSSSVEDSAEQIGVPIDCLGTDLATFCIGGILLLLDYTVGIPVVWTVWFWLQHIDGARSVLPSGVPLYPGVRL